MTEHWTDRLSEYIDGEFDTRQTAALEEHIALCAGCQSTLAELRAVTAAAHSLEDRGPATDLLPGIMQRIAAGDDVKVVPIGARSRSVRRFTFSMPQLAAAASVLMTLSAGTVWMLTRPSATPAPAAVTAVAEPAEGTAAAPAEMAAQFVTATEQSYESTIADLESVLASQLDELDPATIAIIEQNLAIIDAAIAEARAALENDPSRAYLYRHFDNTMNKKVELLRRATSQRSTTT